MEDRLVQIRTISNRLISALSVLVCLFIIGAYITYFFQQASFISAPLAAFSCGVVGGFVGLQRRLKGMSKNDLTLLANSWVYVCLSPLVGGVLAVVTYILFVSGLLAGDLFPQFLPDENASEVIGLPKIFAIHGEAKDYGKMFFWCFVAGFSEKFVTNIINRFESQATEKNTQ